MGNTQASISAASWDPWLAFAESQSSEKPTLKDIALEDRRDMTGWN